MNRKSGTKAKKFQKDPNKKYKRKFGIFPSFLYASLDKWLKKMSLDGWHIVHCGAFSFWFEKGEPSEKEYFTYGLSTQEGKYDLMLQYPQLEKTYGVKKEKSKINSNENKSYNIVEIDIERVKAEKIVGYQELLSDRNRLYTQYFIRNLALFLAPLAVLLLIFIYL